MDPLVQLVHLGERLRLAPRLPFFGRQLLLLASRLDAIEHLEMRQGDRRTQIAAGNTVWNLAAGKRCSLSAGAINVVAFGPFGLYTGGNEEVTQWTNCLPGRQIPVSDERVQDPTESGLRRCREASAGTSHLAAARGERAALARCEVPERVAGGDLRAARRMRQTSDQARLHHRAAADDDRDDCRDRRKPLAGGASKRMRMRMR
jgi:hypothetical protein